MQTLLPNRFAARRDGRNKILKEDLFVEKYEIASIEILTVAAADVISASVTYDANETEEDRFVSA